MSAPSGVKRWIGDASDARNSHNSQVWDPAREDVQAPGAVRVGGVAELDRLGVGQADDRRGVEAHPDREALREVLDVASAVTCDGVYLVATPAVKRPCAVK